jgi:hypothetical protein
VREGEDEERKVKREEEKLGLDLHQFFPPPIFQPAAPIFFRLKLLKLSLSRLYDLDTLSAATYRGRR